MADMVSFGVIVNRQRVRGTRTMELITQVSASVERAHPERLMGGSTCSC